VCPQRGVARLSAEVLLADRAFDDICAPAAAAAARVRAARMVIPAPPPPRAGGAAKGPIEENSIAYAGRKGRVVTCTCSIRSTRYERCSRSSARNAWRRRLPSRVRRSEYGSMTRIDPP